ncbi:MAG: serine protease [Candidatus Pacearchaeota archaeon]|jgi:hypothetical protein
MEKGSKRVLIGILVGVGILIILILAIIFGFSYFFVSKYSPKFDANLTSNLEKTIVFVEYTFDYVDYGDGKSYTNTFWGSGVIFSNKNKKLSIYTNRHVVDCGYIGECSPQRLNETIKIMTYDKKKYVVSKILLPSNDIDLAILELENVNTSYPSTITSQIVNNDEKVIAVGYPAFSQNAIELSKATGVVTGFRDLLTRKGDSFEVIDSTVYTNFGSSGGGLFNEKGELIGITTWSNNYASYAIKMSSIVSTNFDSCENGYFENNVCTKYCQGILDKNKNCILPCESFYCNSTVYMATDTTCEDGMILGEDGLCYQPCGSKDKYCSGSFNSYCFNNKCVVCPQQTILYQDNHCY